MAAANPARSQNGLPLIPIVAALFVSAIAALVLVIVATSPREPAASRQAIPSETVNESSDLFTSIKYEKQIGADYSTPTTSSVRLDFYPFVQMAGVDAEILAQNGTLITLGEKSSTTNNGWTSFIWPITVAHDGKIGPSSEKLDVRIRYQIVDDKGDVQIKSQTLPIGITIAMLDFPVVYYILLLAVGIILSYTLADGSKVVPRVRAQFGEIRRPLVWIIMSLILTPMVYIQFKSAVANVTDQALIALLLALPFGAGLDFAVSKAAAARAGPTS